MAKIRKMEGESSENQLPEAMIQHIQSFLGGKEATQTTVLSKSWYSAWLTRPNLVFNQRDYGDLKSKGFLNLLKKTVQRYKDLNLKVDSLELRMKSLNKVYYSLADELIVEAIKMGAADINFELYPATSAFVLPREVLESESLMRLSVTGCKVEAAMVNCWRLKYLNLCKVFLEEDLFRDIISSCPLIEDLELHNCKSLTKVPSHAHNNNISVKKKTLELSRINLIELHKLTMLFLEKVKLCVSFFEDFSSRFPCLKDLSVHNCPGYKEIQMYSQSIKYISFVHTTMILKAEFDVPNLREFCYTGERLLPCVSFPNSSNWESDICIYYCSGLSSKWLLNLNKLLTNLSQSKVSLFLQIAYFINIDNLGYVRHLPKPFVEDLMIDVSSLDYPALFKSLFQCCRPVFVTEYWHSVPGQRYTEFSKIVYKSLMQHINANCSTLEEFDVEFFDEAVSAWVPVPGNLLLDAGTSAAKQRVRFHLKWG